MKELWRDNLNTGSTNYNVSQGQYGSFLIRYEGDAGAGVTMALSNLGNVILNWNGNDIINVDVELLSLLSNIYGGAIEATSIAGGAFAFSIIIPCGAWFDTKNIYDVGRNDKVYFKLDYPAVPALIDTGSVTIYAKPRAGIHSYFHKILSRTVVSGGAGAVTDKIYDSNISNFYIKNPAALTSNIQIVRDNKVFVDGSPAAELAYSNWIHLLEASETTLAVEFCESQNVKESISSQLVYKFQFSAAGNLACYYSCLIFDSNKQNESLVNAVNYR